MFFQILLQHFNESDFQASKREPPQSVVRSPHSRFLLGVQHSVLLTNLFSLNPWIPVMHTQTLVSL